MTDIPFWWVMARATGVAAYAMLATSVVVGMALKVPALRRVIPAADRMAWHRELGVLGVVMTALHGLALVMDAEVDIDPIDLVVPGGVAYRPLWVGVGVLALWLMAIAAVTAAMRRDLGARVWRPLHRAGYGAFAAAAVHGVMAGTDSGRPWMVAIYSGSVAVVITLAAWRGLAPRAVRAPRAHHAGRTADVAR